MPRGGFRLQRDDFGFYADHEGSRHLLVRICQDSVRPITTVSMPFAQTPDGKPIYPESFSDLEWQAIKSSYQLGDFLLPCCKSPAIPKTSINGVKYFAHYANECSTAPESLWHLDAKDALIKALLQLGASPILEQPINGTRARMKPDVYFLWEGRIIAIEVQHSHQTLKEYLRRQQRYESENVEGYWLLYAQRYLTLSKALGQFRLKRDFGGNYPASGFFPAIPELPIAIFDPEIEGGRITGAGGLRISLAEWLEAVVSRKFSCSNGEWRIA
jgi:competence protein CoiA